MKRNESFLVYGVTALLVVILVVAVVFGEGDGRQVEAQKRAEVTEVESVDDLEDLLLLDPADGLDGTGGDESTDPSAEDDPDPSAEEMQGPPVGDGGVPPVSLDDITAETKPSAELIGSEQVGDYRQVTVRVGDTLSQLVVRWCGSPDYLPQAEALNEDVDHRNLTPGRQILLPWVDDEIVMAARNERQISSTRITAADSKKYTVRGGDSLWRIARNATGSDRQAANYVKQILDSNPGIVPEKLRAGQQIVLP